MSTLLPRSRRRPSCLFDELELQNEELSRSYAEYADSAQRYRELHESAPSAYLTLDHAGSRGRDHRGQPRERGAAAGRQGRAHRPAPHASARE